GSNPRPIVPGVVENLFRALANRETARRARARDRRDAKLRPIRVSVYQNDERGRVQPATRADVNVSVTVPKNRFSRVLQRSVDPTLERRRRTERTRPESGSGV